MKRRLLLVCVVLSAVMSTQALEFSASSGGLFVSAYKRAMRIDAEYRAAEAEFLVNMLDSKIAGSAYYPQINVSSQKIEFEDGLQRNTVSLLQPILSAERMATWREKKPRARIAELTLRAKAYELAERLYRVIAELTLAREGLAQNRARMKALNQQYAASKRAYELGQGTITDQTDARVKMLQAKADDLKLNNKLNAARDEYRSIVGEVPPSFTLNRDSVTGFDDKSDSADYWIDQNVDVILAKLGERLSELEVFRARYAWLPELNASYTRTEINGENQTFTGFSLTLPIQASKLYGTNVAQAKLTMQREQSLQTQRKTRLQIERLISTVRSGLVELSTRKEAISAAQLSVESNEKSYEGGVRSRLDVLMAIEVLYTVENEYVISAVTLGGDLLNLRIQQGKDVLQGLDEVEQMLLMPKNEVSAILRDSAMELRRR